MQQFKFVIPQKLEDLIHPQEDPTIFYVNDELTLLEIAQKLPETEDQLKGDPLTIDNEFGLFFSVLRNFSQLDPQIIDRTWALLFRVTSSYTDQLREVFNVLNDSLGSQVVRDSQNASQSQHVSMSQDTRLNLFESLAEKLRFSNALKMLIYISCSFIHHFEDALSSQNHRQNFNDSFGDTSTPARGKKRPKGKNTGKDVSFKDYDKYKERVTRNLLQLISMPLNRVADSPTEARDIANQVMRVSYKMIENCAINNLTKQKDLLDLNFSILGLGVEKYNQSLSFCLKFIQLLQYREQLAPLLADLFEFIVTRHEQRLLIGEVLREIDRIDVKELSRDSSCPKAVSTFLTLLSDKCPQEFVPFLEHITDYLEQDSYIMRNASLTIISNLIIKVLHTSQYSTLRDELLDLLLAHIKDVVGYTRSRALSVWCTLAEASCLPLAFIEPVTKAAVNRLSDKSCLVRKNAIKFIICILTRNPFAAKLPVKVFEEKYEAEKVVLEKLLETEKATEAKDEEVLETLSKCSMNETITSDTEPEDVHPPVKIKNFALSEESEVVTQKRKVDYLQDAIAFTKQIHRAIPITTELLYSKNVTDVQEAIDFFVQCHEFGIDEALVGFKKMILLINVHEKSVKDTIVAAYKKVFLESSRYDGKSNRDSLAITNFVSFVQTATIGECISLEMLVAQFIESRDFTKEMEHELWARFTGAKANTSVEESIAAIQIIGMMAPTSPDVVNHNLQLCIQYGLASEGCTEEESRLVRETCIAIRKSVPKKTEIDKKRFMKLSREDQLYARLTKILIDSFSDMNSTHWFSMCDEALKLMFDTAENPEKICESILLCLLERLLKDSVQCNSVSTQDTNRNDSPDQFLQPSSMQTGTTMASTPTLELVNPILLARLIHFLGDFALDLAVFLEVDVLLELKARNAGSDGDKSRNNISVHNISVSSRRRSMRYAGNKSVDEQNLEDEIGLGGAEAEDIEAEFIGRICDEEIVCGKNLLAQMSKLIVGVVKDPTRFPQAELKRSASLALAKYMMVSAKFCQDHLRLLFTVLEKSKEPEIKMNLVIAIGDLCIRFPNQLDGWTGKIFNCLQSEEVLVRRTTLKILSRLVLSDILKAKDQISTIANLIVDSDEEISSHASYFFLELNKKQNALYNVVPDIISRLSDSKTGISEANFRIVMKFLFDLIDKSQHIERLVDKLCGRFMDTDDERSWSDLAYCLSLLKYSDKSMVKLFDKFDCYKDKLCLDSVRESITATITNYRKTSHLKNEMKQLLDEFEAKIAKSAGEEKENSQVMDEEGGVDQEEANKNNSSISNNNNSANDDDETEEEE